MVCAQARNIAQHERVVQQRCRKCCVKVPRGHRGRRGRKWRGATFSCGRFRLDLECPMYGGKGAPWKGVVATSAPPVHESWHKPGMRVMYEVFVAGRRVRPVRKGSGHGFEGQVRGTGENTEPHPG